MWVLIPVCLIIIVGFDIQFIYLFAYLVGGRKSVLWFNLFPLSSKGVKEEGLLPSAGTSRSSISTHVFKIYLCSFPLALHKSDADATACSH